MGTVPGSREDARLYPPYFLSLGPNGEIGVPRVFLVNSDAAFSPLRIHLFLLGARLNRDPGERVRRLLSPPWLASHPDARPSLDAPPNTVFGIQVRYLTSGFSWPHLGEVETAPPDERTRSYGAAWANSQTDQVLRQLDTGRPERAVPLASRLYERAPSGYTAALCAESLRASGRRDQSSAFLRDLAPADSGSPLVAVVEALLARDEGAEESARALLARAASRLPAPSILQALRLPPRDWPAGFRQITGALLPAAPRLEPPGQRWLRKGP